VDNTFIIKDSGVREEHASGMVRDTAEGKTDWERIFNGPMAERWAIHLTKGCVKYPDATPGVPNWTLATSQAEMIRAKKSAARHFAQWLKGDVDEDHAAGVFFNINEVEYIKDRLKKNQPKPNLELKSPQVPLGTIFGAKAPWLPALTLALFIGVLVGFLTGAPSSSADDDTLFNNHNESMFGTHNDYSSTALREMQLSRELERQSARRNPC
jgi:hypothetical protein